MTELEQIVKAIDAESSAGRSIAEIVDGPVLRGRPLGLALLGLCRSLHLSLAEGRRYFEESGSWTHAIAKSNALQDAIAESIRNEAVDFPDVDTDGASGGGKPEGSDAN